MPEPEVEIQLEPKPEPLALTAAFFWATRGLTLALLFLAETPVSSSLKLGIRIYEQISLQVLFGLVESKLKSGPECPQGNGHRF